MADEYKCIRCKKTFGWIEMNDRAYKIDEEVLCKHCRTMLDQLYPLDGDAFGNPIHYTKGAVRKSHECALCNEQIQPGSRNLMYKVIRGKKMFMHVSCPDYRPMKLFDE